MGISGVVAAQIAHARLECVIGRLLGWAPTPGVHIGGLMGMSDAMAARQKLRQISWRGCGTRENSA
jgi:hypothetical protein